jgi:hypothetical protein
MQCLCRSSDAKIALFLINDAIVESGGGVFNYLIVGELVVDFPSPFYPRFSFILPI